ncbi:hypothetical protein pb186bvf_014937 [Paramecium bursaria]
MYEDKSVDNYLFNTRNKLGQGSYGEVFAGINKITREKVAIKVLSKKLIDKDEYLRQGLITEIKIMKQVQSENIVKLIDVCESASNYYIIQEFCEGGDLAKFLQMHQNLPEEKSKDVLVQILLGFQELIKSGIIHRDLKPANILINKGVFKLADFGFAKSVDNLSIMLDSCVGTPLYMSPQLLQRQKYTSKCDIWSLGMVFYQCLYGKCPWTARTEQELLEKIINNYIQFPQFPHISQESKDFIINCLTISEQHRISWEQLFKHSLIKNKFKYPIKIQDNTMLYIINDLRQLLIRKRITASRLFQQVSKNKRITLNDFHNFLQSINNQITVFESSFVFKIIDVDKSNFIDFNELQQWFKQNNIIFDQLLVIENRPKNNSIQVQQKTEDVINKLVTTVYKYNIDTKTLFTRFDSSGDGLLDYKEICQLSLAIDPTLKEPELMTIFMYFDINRDGQINAEEFQKIFECETDLLDSYRSLSIQQKESNINGPGLKIEETQRKYLI